MLEFLAPVVGAVMNVGIFAIIVGILILVLISKMYRIVDVSEAHVVVTPKGKKIISSDTKISNQNWYINIPRNIPLIGRTVRVIDVSVHETIIEQITIEKGQARYHVTSSTKYRVTDVGVAAETFRNFKELDAFLKEIIEASIPAVTVKYEIETARSKKSDIEADIRKEMEDDFAKFGLTIQNFNLVDFQDTPDSASVSSISRRREAEIESNTAIEVAEREKAARVKKAEADQTASVREIEAEQVKQEREQEMQKVVQEKLKTAEIARLEVVKTQTIKQQEIDKEKAIILAQQQKEMADILKDKLHAEGTGERLKAEEIARGNAAKIREDLTAEADGKAKLQEALSGFDTNAINAMVAQQVVEAQKQIGLAGAEALKNADLKVFVGDGGKQGFDIGQLIAAVRVSDSSTAGALLNRVSTPNDLGFGKLPVVSEIAKTVEKTVEGK